MATNFEVDLKEERSVNQKRSTSVNYKLALAVMTSLFFMWGFLTCLNDILVPHLKGLFTLNYTQTMLIQFVFFGAYFLVALPSGKVLEILGYKRGIIVGLTVAGIGSLIFFPAAGLQSYPVFLLALFVLASGITLLQVSANPYVAILGKPETASSRLNLAQAVNSLGHTLAPLFGSVIILSVASKTVTELSKLSPAELEAYKHAKAAAVQTPYIGLAIALFLLAGVIAAFKLPKISNSQDSSDSSSSNMENLHKSAWGYRHLYLGAIGIFLYVGAEVSIGSFLVSFMSEKTIAGFSAAEAGKYVSFYWGGAMIGRFIGSILLRKFKPGKALCFNALVAATLVGFAILTTGHLAMWTILAVGLFNSIMFPNIFSLGIAGLGKHTSQASGILVMAIVGGAVIPLFQGILADNIGIHSAFILPLLCYFYIAYYGLKGSIPQLGTAK